MQLELTAVFQKVPEGYIGFVEELPGANTQGATLEEARKICQDLDVPPPREKGHRAQSPVALHDPAVCQQ